MLGDLKRVLKKHSKRARLKYVALKIVLKIAPLVSRIEVNHHVSTLTTVFLHIEHIVGFTKVQKWAGHPGSVLKAGI